MTYIRNFDIALPAYWTLGLCIHAWGVASTPYFSQWHLAAIRKKKLSQQLEICADVMLERKVQTIFPFFGTTDANIKQNGWIWRVIWLWQLNKKLNRIKTTGDNRFVLESLPQNLLCNLAIVTAVKWDSKCDR